MKRRLLVWLAVLCFAAGTVWSGGNGSAPQTTQTGEKPEITVMDFYEFCPQATSETLAFKWWGEAVNATIVPVHVPRPDFDVKMSTLLASRDFPDIMKIVGDKNKNIHMEYGPEGWFVNVTEQMEKGNMPNLKWVEGHMPGQIFLYAHDGNSYMTPNLKQTLVVTPVFAGFSLRAELMKKAGWDIDPKELDKKTQTWEGILDAIRAVYKGFNMDRDQPVPIIHNRGVRGLTNDFIVPRACNNFDTWLRIWYNTEDRYEFGPLSDKFKYALQFLNALYAEGILHPEWMVMEEEVQAQLDWREGRLGVEMRANPGRFENLGVNDPFPAAITYVCLPPIIDGERAKWRAPGNIRGTYVMNANSKNVAKVVEAQDYTYGEEGADMLKFGREGYTFIRDDSPFGKAWLMMGMGWYQIKELPSDAPSARADGFHEGVNRSYPPSLWWMHPWANYSHPDYTPEREIQMADQIAYKEEWVNSGLWIDEPEPIFIFTKDETDEKAQIEAALHTYVDEELVKFIHGQNSFADWDQFVKKQTELGAERLEQIYNTALDRHLNK